MSLLKKLPHRDWETLRDLWVDHLPAIDFEAEFPEPTLWHLPEIKEKLPAVKATTELPYIEGARESVFREAIVLARKFTYCRRCALNATQYGSSTWSLVAAYDACFYGAKAFCYLLGIASIERFSKFYLDIFALRTYKAGKATRQAYDILLAYRLDAHLTHQMLWDLTGRLARTIKFPEEAVSLQARLRAADFDKISNVRNNLIYDGGFWLNVDAVEHCDLVRPLADWRLFKAMNSGVQEDDDEADSLRYFQVAQLLSDVLRYFFTDIGQLAPVVRVEAQALANWKM